MSLPAHIRIRYSVRGGHVHTTWFSGKTQDTTHGKNGELVFTLAEWYTLQSVLNNGMSDVLSSAPFEFIEEP
ncbi:MAG TPA: hypothetical protein VND65_01835 [Candidatus Binatia bacterium]|nr:hypothetical protein [Candidatus Binatia bacterium]